MTRSDRCLRHAADGRCASCPDERMGPDVRKTEGYGFCGGPRDYETRVFHVPGPDVLEGVP